MSTATATATAAPAKKTAVKKPAAKKAAPTKKASKSTARAITIHIEQFRKETGKKVNVIVQKVINRTDCLSFSYDNNPFVVFAKEGSEESAVTKVVQAYNAGN